MVKIPWETTDDYIRSGHRQTSDFQPNSLRTFTLSEEEGIRAVIGKPKGQNTTEVQSYLFSKEKGWTLEKAKAWFKEHQGERVREHVSVLMPFQIVRKITDKPLKIRGVATMAGIDKNMHIITEEELQRFAEKLVAAPIYYEHIQAQNAVGKVTGTEYDPETRALFYEAEIYDEGAQQKVRKGLINHVSIGANYGRLDVLDGIAFYDLYDAELSLVAVPAVSGTSVQVMQKLNQPAPGSTGVLASPAPSSATESSGMEEKKIEEKFQEIDKKLERISQHLKVPKPQTIPQILQNIDSKMANIEKRLSKIERANEDEAAVELTTEEIKQKIADLTSQKAALTEKLEGATEEERGQIQEQIDSLNLEIQALQKALEAKTAESTNEGGVEQKLGQAVIVPQETKGDQESTLKDLTLREVMEAQQ